MKQLIMLPDIESVNCFVHNSELCEEAVLVSKEGYKFEIDGSSIIGMMSLIGSKLMVNYNGKSKNLLSIIEKYRVV